MKVLYIHQYFGTPETPGSIRSYEFARHLIRQGHDVTMISLALRLQRYLPARRRLVHDLDVEGIRVLAIRVPYANEMGWLRRILSFFRFMVVSSWLVVSHRDHDLVYASSTPLTVGIPGALFKLRTGKPFVFEVRDLWPEAPIALGLVRNGLLAYALRRFERFLYARADAVVALSPGMVDGVRAKGAGEKVVMIPNAADLHLFDPSRSGSAFRERHGLQGCFLVVYTGAVSYINGLDYLVEAAQRLSGEDAIRFLVVGRGNQRERLVEKARRLHLRNLIFLEPVAKADLAEVLAAADVTVVSFANAPALAWNSPNKFFDYLAAGRPVLVNFDGWIADLLSQWEAGAKCSPKDPGEMAECVLRLRSDSTLRCRMGARARQLAEEVFDRRRLSRAMEEVLIRVASGKRPGPVSTGRGASPMV